MKEWYRFLFPKTFLICIIFHLFIKENERSEIEAELPVDMKTKTFLNDGETIEIDKKRYFCSEVTYSNK